jgi:fibronectin-binding autotransporter adhesin
MAIGLRAGVSFLALAMTALALGAVPAWADGGVGKSVAGGNGGAGGTDGSLADATGKDGTGANGEGGGGGGLNLDTGDGAAGGGTVVNLGGPQGPDGATGTTVKIVPAQPGIIDFITFSYTGGTGGQVPGSTGVTGGAGGGGAGIKAFGDVTVLGGFTVTGGTGGATGLSSATAGGAGGGGAGIFSDAGVTLVVNATAGVVGGTGGKGFSLGGGGGGGAAAIVLTNGGTVQNSGTIRGGTGGLGSATTGAGDGGAGLLLTTGGIVTNALGGSITGGNAGATGFVGGDGGAGLEGSGIYLTNAGTIAGGNASTTAVTHGVAGNAIEFTGGTNTLELWGTSVINGHVAANGADDTLALGGSGAGSFDVTRIGTSQYEGFEHFEKTGTSTWTLTGTTTEATPWTIRQGALAISDNGNLGNVASTVTLDGGALEVTADMSSARHLALAGAGTITVDTGKTFTVTGTLDGAGGLTKTGDGDLVIAADTTHTGGTTISAGVLQVGNGGTAGSLSGDVVDNASLVFNRSDSMIADGDISGTGTLTQVGAGTVTLTGANTYTGGTTITTGTLVVGDGTTHGSMTGNVHNLGTLAFDRSDDVTFAGTITGGGMLEQRGAGTLHLTGNYAGLTTISAGTLVVGNGFGAGAVVDNGTLVYERTSNTAINNVVSGTGSVVFAGTGSTQVNGLNSYTGGTVIQSGTISILNNNNLGATNGSVTMEGGTLGLFQTMTFTHPVAVTGNAGLNVFSNKTVIVTGPLDGAGNLTKTGTGNLVIGSDATLTGTTTIAQGTLTIGDGATHGSFSGTIVDNAKLVFNRSDSQAAAGIISGTGTLQQLGTGTLALSGHNTYSGATTVTNGTLLVNGDQSGAIGLTTAMTGATLGGHGTIGGDVAMKVGSVLAPGGENAVGALTINGKLGFEAGSAVDFEIAGHGAAGALNDLVIVKGDVDATGVALNVATVAGAAFDPGIYRLMDYEGVLTGSFTPNNAPAGASWGSHLLLQTAIDHQVNLVNTAGLVFRFWDGAGGGRNDEVIDGADGTWKSGDNFWTAENGDINNGFTSRAFAVFEGDAGAVTVDGAGVAASGMQFLTDGYVVNGSTITLDSPIGPEAVIRVGDGTTAGADITATIGSVLAGTAQVVKADAGTLILTAHNTYTGGTAVGGGVLKISTDANLGDAAGAVALDGGVLETDTSFDSARAFVVTGAGGLDAASGTTLTLTGAFSGTGELDVGGGGKVLLTGDSSGFAGKADIQSGILSVNGAFGGGIDVTGGRLQGGGQVGDTTVESGGTVAPGNSIATLTINGDYVGNGGTLEIEAELGGDASPSDKLVVTGNTSGSTNVHVINLGGNGAATVEGIRIVDVGGTSAGTFTLASAYLFHGDAAVVGGAYSYRLYKGGVSTPADGDWYLRSSLTDPVTPPGGPGTPGDPGTPGGPGVPGGPGTPGGPLYQPGAPVYEVFANVLQDFNGLDSFRQRTGNRSWGDGVLDGGEGRSLWGRISAGHRSIDPNASTTDASHDTDTWQLQAGADGLLYANEAGQLTGGLSARYGTLSADIGSLYGDGGIEATGYGLGGSLTWQAHSGFYIDGQANLTWYDGDLSSATAGTSLASGVNGFGYAAGVEVGQQIALGPNWSITPQAQLSYSSIDYDDFTDTFGAAVSLGKSDSLKGRLGISADYQNSWTDASGDARSLDAYGIANLTYDFRGRTRTTLAGVTLTSQDDPLWGSIGVGGSYSWGGGKYSLHGETSINSSLDHFGDSYDVRGTAGFNVKF